MSASPTCSRFRGATPSAAIPIAAIIQAALDHKAALEVNSSLHRLDLKDIHVRMAVEAGVDITIDTDAHSIEDLPRMHYGVRTARRGFVQKQHVVNAWSLSKLESWIAESRS